MIAGSIFSISSFCYQYGVRINWISSPFRRLSEQPPPVPIGPLSWLEMFLEASSRVLTTLTHHFFIFGELGERRVTIELPSTRGREKSIP